MDIHGIIIEIVEMMRSWDFYDDDDILNRFYGLLYDNGTQNAWFDYVTKMYNVLSQYDNFKEGFLTWEDFWNVLGICDDLEDNRRLEHARRIGYGEWVKKRYTLDTYNEKYGTNYNSYNQIMIPRRDEPSMYAMYEYYDDFLVTLLTGSQRRFPNLSMEVRVDWDVTYNKNGEIEYYKHMDTFTCGESDFTATMYGIPMGFDNIGEKVSYEAGIEKTKYILSQLQQQNEGKPIYVEQFIFADNTPAFKNTNAQIKEEELDDYLENISNVLLNYTSGYGIWTYKNYRANMIYNSQFALKSEGWEYKGNVQFPIVENSIVCKLGENSEIFQKVSDARNHFDSNIYQLAISIKDVIQEGELKVTVGSTTQIFNIQEKEILELTVDKNESFDLKIETLNSSICIDDIRLYSQIQEGFLYDENANELPCAKSIRILNSQLE